MEANVVDFGELADKTQEALKNVSDEQIEQAADFIQDKVEDKYDGLVDKAAEAAKNLNNK